MNAGLLSSFEIGDLTVRYWLDPATGRAGSRQMEIYRRFDDVCLSGGHAELEFWHWSKGVLPGENLKVDYNDTLGIGCDYPDSYGQGLRR